MKKSKLRVIFIVGMVVFILCQILIRFNTSLLMRDLDKSMWSTSLRLPASKKVQILTETAKEYGEYKHAYESSIYYMIGAAIVLTLFVICTSKGKGEQENSNVS